MNGAAHAYFGAGTLLFFFWVYGIYAFARDLRGRYLPAVRQYRRERGPQRATTSQGPQAPRRASRQRTEREDRERQLY